VSLIYSYSFLDQDRNCPEAARQLFIIKEFKKTWTVKGGIDDHKELEKRLKYQQPLPAPLAKAEPLVRSLEQSGPVGAEISYAVKRDLTPTSFWDKGAFLRGKYDVVLKWPDKQRAFIGDWKSGKVRESEDQLELGALLLMASEPQVQEVTGVNLWLQVPKLGTPYKFTRPDQGPRWAKWLARINAVEKRDPKVVWEKREGALCSYCPVKVCEHYRGG
jgi:hypothetical protein